MRKFYISVVSLQICGLLFFAGVCHAGSDLPPGQIKNLRKWSRTLLVSQAAEKKERMKETAQGRAALRNMRQSLQKLIDTLRAEQFRASLQRSNQQSLHVSSLSVNSRNRTPDNALSTAARQRMARKTQALKLAISGIAKKRASLKALEDSGATSALTRQAKKKARFPRIPGIRGLGRQHAIATAQKIEAALSKLNGQNLNIHKVEALMDRLKMKPSLLKPEKEIQPTLETLTKHRR